MTPILQPEFAPILQTIVFLSAAIVLVLSEPAINRMSPCASLITQLSFHFLAVGAFGNLVWIWMGDVPNWPETIIIAGIALMLVCGRMHFAVE